MTTTETTTPLDRTIDAAQAGRAPMEELFRALMTAELAVPSGQEVLADGSGFQPVLFDKEGTPMVACFSSRDGFVSLDGLAPYALMMNGAAFLKRVPPGHGVVVNPGHQRGFEISPDGLGRVLRDFGPA